MSHLPKSLSKPPSLLLALSGSAALALVRARRAPASEDYDARRAVSLGDRSLNKQGAKHQNDLSYHQRFFLDDLSAETGI